VPDRYYRVDYEDLSNQVYRMLKHMILVGELKTGEKLRQDELAERLGVSRTPLLSAFSKLEKEMLVETIPRRGAFVKKYEITELVDIYEIRIRLEPFGAAEAARNASDEQVAELKKRCREFGQLAASEDPKIKELDYEFHMHIMEMSGNQLLYNIISSYSIIPIANFYGFFKVPTVSAMEHEALCQAIYDRNITAARREMFQHVNSSLRHLKEYIAGRSESAPHQTG
jgi:DNA-binding GntR family transcriptional regulator